MITWRHRKTYNSPNTTADDASAVLVTDMRGAGLNPMSLSIDHGKVQFDNEGVETFKRPRCEIHVEGVQ